VNIFGGGKIKALEAQLRALQTAVNRNINNVNRNIAVYPTSDITNYTNRYAGTDDVYSIVRMLSTTAAMVPLRAYEVKPDDAAQKAYKSIRESMRPHANLMHTKALQLKALEDLPETDPLESLLSNPSPFQSKFEFFEAIYTYMYICGEAFIYKEKPFVGKYAGKTASMVVLRPENVILKITDTAPKMVVAYDYVIDGQKILENVPLEDMIHIKYLNTESGWSGSDLRGLSPLKVLANRLTQIDANQDVQTAQLQNGGVESIVWDSGEDTASGSVSVNGLRKQAFYKHVHDNTNAGLPYFASGEMGVIHLGSTLADLKVIESAQVSFKKLCNAFGTSDVLFNNSDASTESNVSEMVRRTYTNTTLPNVYRVRDAFIKSLLPEFADKKRDIREDLSEIQELQPNSKLMAEWLAIAWWVSPNDKLEMMRFERNPNPIFDQPLIPQGLQTIDDLIMPDPIDSNVIG
jgi:HK97 family phage portal protein